MLKQKAWHFAGPFLFGAAITAIAAVMSRISDLSDAGLTVIRDLSIIELSNRTASSAGGANHF